jgi:hypothetical protein
VSKHINLIDYLGEPELISHVDKGDVRAIHHFQEMGGINKILVVFENGAAYRYAEDGRYVTQGDGKFILKPKPKKTITGWRRGILCPKGRFNKAPMFYPTKKAFEIAHSSYTFFGPWESETIEIEE